MPFGNKDGATLFAILLLYLVITATSSALGQESDAPDNAKQQIYQLESVTVTAQKKKENVQEVPESISVISSQDIEDAHLTEASQIHTVVPNFMSYGTNNRAISTPMFNMRGLGNLYEGDSAVSIYIDDIPITDPSFFSFPLDNIERIEVLRGPQGTLYGMNTEGGVVNIITRQPKDAFEATAGAEYGSYNTYKVAGALRGPLVQDRLSFGLSLLAEGTDGAIENKYTGNDVNGWTTLAGNANFRWTVTPLLDVQFNIAADSNDDGDFIWVVKDRAAYNAVWAAGLDEYDISVNDEGFAENDSNRESLKITYNLPWADLVSVTSRIARTDDVGGDLDCTTLDYMSFTQSNEKEQYSQEFRLASPAGEEDLSWIFGAFYSTQDYEYEQVFNFGSDFPMPFAQTTDASYDNETYAVFGQSTVRLLDAKFGITAGLRYEHAIRSIQRSRYYTMNGVRYAINDPLLGSMASAYSGIYDQKDDFDSLLPRFILDYRLTPSIMVYSSAALGYKAGGFSTIANNPALAGYDPEYAWTYEVGLKSRFLDDRLMVNLSGFATDVEDYQDRVVIDNVVTMKNAAKAKIYGAEAELRARPLPGLDFTASLGVLQAKYDDYTDTENGQTVRFDGNSIALVPDYQYNVAAQYRFQSGIYLKGEISGVSKSYFTRENIDRMSQNGYEIVNARVGYETERFDVYVYGKNLLDEYYYTQLSDTTSYGVPGVSEVGCVGDPTTFGVMFKFRF
jgi:iron complex outermembrane receptor protein